MDNELKDRINDMDLPALKFLEKNLIDGTLKQYLRKKITLLDDKVCANCMSKVDPFQESFTLQFGQEDFRKQAHFCALDCMEYFIDGMKEKNNKKMN